MLGDRAPHSLLYIVCFTVAVVCVKWMLANGSHLRLRLAACDTTALIGSEWSWTLSRARISMGRDRFRGAQGTRLRIFLG